MKKLFWSIEVVKRLSILPPVNIDIVWVDQQPGFEVEEEEVKTNSNILLPKKVILI